MPHNTSWTISSSSTYSLATSPSPSEYTNYPPQRIPSPTYRRPEFACNCNPARLPYPNPLINPATPIPGTSDELHYSHKCYHCMKADVKVELARIRAKYHPEAEALEERVLAHEADGSMYADPKAVQGAREMRRRAMELLERMNHEGNELRRRWEALWGEGSWKEAGFRWE
ncbi:hypothetical protein MMC25_004678 [Agyrium rufum]|nr:hypothetical protein [Agyrium rufum]